MNAPATLRLDHRPDGTLVVGLGGSWTIGHERPGLDEVERAIAAAPPPASLSFDASGLDGWDSAALAWLLRVVETGERAGLRVDRAGLPDGVERLLELATAVPERSDSRARGPRPGFVTRLGHGAIGAWESLLAALAFLGELSESFARLCTGRAQIRGRDVGRILQSVGAEALGIVSLISFLVGMIFAFVGAVQLRQFGAQIYVANLVGLAMVREMGAMMTAIIMAGRTGSGFAAEIGTMVVNREVDALRTFGFAPMDFLVLPRVIALTLMMPLLCVYSNFVGMAGGAFVSRTMLEIPLATYIDQLQQAISLTNYWIGVGKSSVFGILVALAGCYRGIQCGGNAAAVGDAATSAVVTGIVLIIATDGIFAVIFNILNI